MGHVQLPLVFVRIGAISHSLIAGVDIILVLIGIVGPSNIATGMVQVMASHGPIRCDLSSRQQRAVRAISKKGQAVERAILIIPNCKAIYIYIYIIYIYTYDDI